jgi:transglutaminase-like putative cysteine protease
VSDIGVAVPRGPMDFAAWFEAYIGGRWQTFDARNNVPRIGRVLMARGRDATDVAISNTFGPNTLAGFSVWAQESAPWTGLEPRPPERDPPVPKGTFSRLACRSRRWYASHR